MLENTYFTFFSRFQKTWLFKVFWNDVSKNVKRHKKVSRLLNVHRNFGLKTPRCYGYLWASHTVLSCTVFCVHTSEQDIWCWWLWIQSIENSATKRTFADLLNAFYYNGLSSVQRWWRWKKSRFFSWSPRGPKIAIVRSSNVYYDHGQLPASWRHHREYYPSCIGALNIHWRPWPHLESTLQRNWYQESYAPRQCPTLNRTSAVLIGLDAWIDCKLYWRLRLVSHAGDAALKGVKTYANLCGRAFHWASKIGPTFGIILSWNWS